MHGFISGLSILFHWSIFLFLCQYHTVLMTVALQCVVWSQEGWFLQLHSSFSRLLWLFRVFCCLHMNCEIFCSSSVKKKKNAIYNLIGITFNMQTLFGSIVIFTILIFPTQEHGIALHLFMLSLIFSLCCLIIFCAQFFCLLR